MSILPTLDDLRIRLDSWRNTITGLGVSGVDSRLLTQAVAPTVVSDAELSNMFHGDDLSYKIVAALPSEALSRSFGISAQDSDLETQWLDDLWALGGYKLLLRAAVFSRLYGGGAVLIGAIDGTTRPDLPLREAGIREIRYLRFLDRRRLIAVPGSIDLDPMSATFGEPLLYEITTSASLRSSQSRRVHRSRLVFFGAALTDDQIRETIGYWDLSVLQRVRNVIADNAEAWASVANRLRESSYSKVVIKELAAMIAAGREEAVKARIAALNYGRSHARAILLDAEEAYTRDTDNMSGVDKILSQIMSRVAAAADMPVTKLWGVSAGGLNSTGDSEADDWNKQVQAYREHDLAPAIERILYLIGLAKGYPVDKPWELTWPELEPMSDKERAEIYKLTADADAVYLNAQVVDPEEVALHRFREGGYDSTNGIQIDRELREQQQALGRDYKLELAENPPLPPGMPSEGLEGSENAPEDAPENDADNEDV